MWRAWKLRREAARELEYFGMSHGQARRAAARVVLSQREFQRWQLRLNEGDPVAVAAAIGAFRESGERPPDAVGTLLVTLHYGLYPLLWLWLKSRLPRFTLLYSSELYRPDVSPGQYARFSALGVVPSERDDLDLSVLGSKVALATARERLASGGSVLIFPDAVAVPIDRPGALVCRVGAQTVAYPGGAAALAQVPGCRLQSVVLRDGEIVWGSSRDTPATADEVASVVQELIDSTVAQDPTLWQAWVSE